MHEASLARSVLQIVLERASKAGAKRVRAVRGRIAETEALSRSALEAHFAALARGTLAEGAIVALAVERVRVRCRRCGLELTPDHHVLLCNHCGAAEVEMLGQTGVTVETLEVEG